MKKHFFAISIATLLLFGCSNNETEPIQEANLTLNYSKMIKEIVDNEDFNTYLNTKSKNLESTYNKSSDNNGKGVMFVEGGGAFSNFIGFFTYPYLVFVYDLDDEGNPAAMVDVKVFSEDKAQFTANVNRPGVEISNFETGEFYSNICDDKKIGHLQVNWIASYNVIDFGFGPLYMANPEGASTTNNLQLSAKVNDSFVLTSPETGEGECNDANITKSIKLTFVAKENNNQGLAPIFKLIGLD
jgi:hypothetical protein